MSFAFEMAKILIPFATVSGIALFVVFRMKHKYEKGILPKKKTKNAQILLDSLIPLGMLAGSAASVLISTFFQISLLATIGWGPGIGFLFGYFAYEIYGNKKESY